MKKVLQSGLMLVCLAALVACAGSNNASFGSSAQTISYEEAGGSLQRGGSARVMQDTEAMPSTPLNNSQN